MSVHPGSTLVGSAAPVDATFPTHADSTTPYERRLPPVQVAGFFSASCGHVPVDLRRPPAPKVIWHNARAAAGQTDPVLIDPERLLQAAAWELAQPGEADSDPRGTFETSQGYVDRYGGDGIGTNGGSGRAAVLGPFHVKGLGRTPLVSSATDAAHASGGAYLEECVREVILSEIAAAEFPHGAVPALAVVLTGRVQIWATDSGPKSERRSLLVRPCVLRPAHFERATRFLNGNQKEGALDSSRVNEMFDAATRLWGRGAFEAQCGVFFARWIEQIAYSWVHRLPHCGVNTSNVAFDAAWLDFGAMAAVPSWAQIDILPATPPFGAEIALVASASRSLEYHFSRYLDGNAASSDASTTSVATLCANYQWAVFTEALRLFGLTRRAALAVRHSTGVKNARSDAVEAIGREIHRLTCHFQREHFTLFEGTPEPRIVWDIDQLWRPQPPVHLRGLRQAIERHVPAADLAHAPARCKFRSRSRQRLYRETIKTRIYNALERDLPGAALEPEAVGNFIHRDIVDSRRDARADPDDAVPIGFASGAQAGYALFRSANDGQRFAVEEWGVDGSISDVIAPKRRSIVDASDEHLDFSDGSPRFEGAVALLE